MNGWMNFDACPITVLEQQQTDDGIRSTACHSAHALICIYIVI